jgi:hypothetical protein
MEQWMSLLASLPGWMILVVAVVWVVTKQVIPRINKGGTGTNGHAPSPPRGASVPQMAAISPSSLNLNGLPPQLSAFVQQLLQQFHDNQRRYQEELQKILEHHFELDRQQLGIMETVAHSLDGVQRRLESDSKQTIKTAEQNLEVLRELKEAVLESRLASSRATKLVESLSERVDRVAENTGRFRPPKRDD